MKGDSQVVAMVGFFFAGVAFHVVIGAGSGVAVATNALELARNLLSSNFSIAAIGALAGAFAGAYGAQRIVERSRRRTDYLSEIRSTNAAIMAAFSICNTALMVKRQFCDPVRNKFIADKSEVTRLMSQPRRRERPPFHVNMDLRTFKSPSGSIDTLRGLVFEKISSVGRPLALVAMIEQAIEGAKESFAARQALVQKFQSGEIPEEEKLHHYFGTRLPDGTTHQEFADVVEAMHSYTEDIAFFSSLLCSDLAVHGAWYRDAYVRSFRDDPPEISKVDLTSARASGLIPPESQYTAWLNGFSTDQLKADRSS